MADSLVPIFKLKSRRHSILYLKRSFCAEFNGECGVDPNHNSAIGMPVYIAWTHLRKQLFRMHLPQLTLGSDKIIIPKFSPIILFSDSHPQPLLFY